MKFSQLPSDLAQTLQLNAGIICETFNVQSGTAGTILAATSGGANFNATPTFVDMGDDIDNLPANMKEMKKLDYWTATLSGTFVSVDSNSATKLAGAADYDSSTKKITPRNKLQSSDFHDLWWVGDYSDVNDGDSAGCIAIHLKDCISTGGFQIQSADNGKGQLSFTFTAHYSMTDTDAVPFEIYIK